MTSKFREALDRLERLNQPLYPSDKKPYFTIEDLGQFAYMEMETIRQALLIAERLESGDVSDKLRYAIWRAQYEQSNKDGHPDSVLHDCAMARVNDKNQKEIDTVAIKAMAKVMIEEAGNGK